MKTRYVSFLLIIIFLLTARAQTTANGIDQYERYDYFKYHMVYNTYVNNDLNSSVEEIRLYTFLGERYNKLSFNLATVAASSRNDPIPHDISNYLVDPNSGYVYSADNTLLEGYSSVVYTSNSSSLHVNDTVDTITNQTVDDIINYTFNGLSRSALDLSYNYQNDTYSRYMKSKMDLNYGFYYNFVQNTSSNHTMQNGDSYEQISQDYSIEIQDYHIQALQGDLENPFTNGIPYIDFLKNFELFFLSVIVITVAIAIGLSLRRFQEIK